jgi:hypothetical protein
MGQAPSELRTALIVVSLVKRRIPQKETSCLRL